MGRQATDGFADLGRYAPRVDIAVGPFNISHDVARNVAEIRRVAASHRQLIGRLQRGGDLTHNENPRCLLAIEIAFSGTSKHILGDFTNASMMGLIGIVVGGPESMAKVSRIREYVRWLQRVGKAPASLFQNVVLFNADEFEHLIGITSTPTVPRTSNAEANRTAQVIVVAPRRPG